MTADLDLTEPLDAMYLEWAEHNPDEAATLTPAGIRSVKESLLEWLLPALPMITGQLREQIAQEIESNIDWSDGRWNYGDNAGYEHAARIARGGDQS